MPSGPRVMSIQLLNTLKKYDLEAERGDDEIIVAKSQQGRDN